jgi:hypothetical protein
MLLKNSAKLLFFCGLLQHLSSNFSLSIFPAFAEQAWHFPVPIIILSKDPK